MSGRRRRSKRRRVSTPEPVRFDSIPQEVLTHSILGFVPWKDLVDLVCRVSQSWNGCAWTNLQKRTDLKTKDALREVLQLCPCEKLLVRFLSEGVIDPSFDPYGLLEYSIFNNQPQTFMFAVEKVGARPHAFRNLAIQWACRQGHRDCVRLMLAKPGLVDVTVQDQLPIRIASLNGHFEIVQLLLRQPECKPGHWRNWALHQAIMHGHEKVAIALGVMQSVNVGLNDSIDFRLACKKGLARFVKTFIRQALVDPVAKHNEAIKSAIDHNRPTVVRALLDDGRANPAVENSRYFRLACENNFHVIVKMLLADGRCNPAAVENLAIRAAATRGFEEVVKLLLADPRVNPDAKRGEAVRWAALFGHTNVVLLLLSDPRAGMGNRATEARQAATEKGHTECAQAITAFVQKNRSAAYAAASAASASGSVQQ